jgi:hypothetical protein
MPGVVEEGVIPQIHLVQEEREEEVTEVQVQVMVLEEILTLVVEVEVVDGLLLD